VFETCSKGRKHRKNVFREVLGRSDDGKATFGHFEKNIFWMDFFLVQDFIFTFERENKFFPGLG
jgi:hypothetical protein